MTDHAKNLRSIRSDLIGTKFEALYWECHAAADYIDELKQGPCRNDCRKTLQEAFMAGFKAGYRVDAPMDLTAFDEWRKGDG